MATLNDSVLDKEKEADIDAETINHDNVQGDLYSRGFPKDYETYYFFTILENREKEFSKALLKLVDQGHISSLTKVLKDRTQITDFKVRISNEGGGTKPPKEHIVNTLIAFSKLGLQQLQKAFPANDDRAPITEDDIDDTDGHVRESDPSFWQSMWKDRELCDPDHKNWEPPFNQPDLIHGVFKIAAAYQEDIDQKLAEIRVILDKAAADVGDKEGPIKCKSGSRFDGSVRPDESRGKEHFGYQDGISQPLMAGVDGKDAIKSNPLLTAARNLVLVSPPPYVTIQKEAYPPPKHSHRPKWMMDGSFMAFRKLEQDVSAFRKLTEDFAAAGCSSAEHLGAKLFGRWESGAPISVYPNATKDPFLNAAYHKSGVANHNEWIYDKYNNSKCPMAAHTRKVNTRDGLEVNARVVRSGIPYGKEFDADPTSKRGMLFACYQSCIENGFRFLQLNWSNNAQFPNATSTGKQKFRPGHDPIIGQVPKGEKLAIDLSSVNDEANKRMVPELTFDQLTTMKGGEYFFVPSIGTLRKFGSA